MIWDRENEEWTDSLPANRFRLDFGVRIPKTSKEDWDNDRIGHSSHRCEDFSTKEEAIARGEAVIKQARCSWASVSEIEAVMTPYDPRSYEWDAVDDEPIWD